MLRIRRLGLLLPMALAGACGGDGAPADFTAVDSAGVTIAVSTRPAWSVGIEEAWRIAPAPVLDLTRTGTGPAHEFYRVTDATRFHDGRIVVANSGTSELRMFSAEGLPLTTVGRDGEGPGEYKRIMSVHRTEGDSLIVHSWPTRVSVLDPDLGFVRSFALQSYVRGVHPLEHGFLLATLIFPSLLEYEGVERVIRARAPLVRLTMAGQVIDTVATAAGVEELMTERGSSRILFGRDLSVGVGAGSIVTGDAERMEFTVLSPDGVPTLIARVPEYPLALSRDELEAEKAGLLGPNPSARGLDAVSKMPIPDTKPAYTALVVDAEGYFWAGAFHGFAARGQQPRSWEIFDRRLRRLVGSRARSGAGVGPIAPPRSKKRGPAGVATLARPSKKPAIALLLLKAHRVHSEST